MTKFEPTYEDNARMTGKAVRLYRITRAGSKVARQERTMINGSEGREVVLYGGPGTGCNPEIIMTDDDAQKNAHLMLVLVGRKPKAADPIDPADPADPAEHGASEDDEAAEHDDVGGEGDENSDQLPLVLTIADLPDHLNVSPRIPKNWADMQDAIKVKLAKKIDKDATADNSHDVIAAEVARRLEIANGKANAG